MLVSNTLFLAASSPTLLGYFGSSNLAGKTLVLVLLATSFLAWTLMIGKFLDLKRLHVLNAGLEQKLLKNGTSAIQPKAAAGSGPYGAVLSAGMQAHHRWSQRDPLQRQRATENALMRSVTAQAGLYENKLVWLGSIVTAAPFIGLLGTVWGVMDAFGSLGLSESAATLQALAPGVSGALLTTVAGLLVAIPSVIGYNALLSTSRSMVSELENFASLVADKLAEEAE